MLLSYSLKLVNTRRGSIDSSLLNRPSIKPREPLSDYESDSENQQQTSSSSVELPDQSPPATIAVTVEGKVVQPDCEATVSVVSDELEPTTKLVSQNVVLVRLDAT